jgi:hypothetical protein
MMALNSHACTNKLLRTIMAHGGGKLGPTMAHHGPWGAQACAHRGPSWLTGAQAWAPRGPWGPKLGPIMAHHGPCMHVDCMRLFLKMVRCRRDVFGLSAPEPVMSRSARQGAAHASCGRRENS